MAVNIRFNYLYRDPENWKDFNSVCFHNPKGWSLEKAESKIRKYLIDELFFYPKKIGIPTFHFHNQIEGYPWYEFESLEFCYPQEKTIFSISDFIKLLKNNNIVCLNDLQQPQILL